MSEYQSQGGYQEGSDHAFAPWNQSDKRPAEFDADEARKISKEPSMCIYDQPGFVPGIKR